MNQANAAPLCPAPPAAEPHDALWCYEHPGVGPVRASVRRSAHDDLLWSVITRSPGSNDAFEKVAGYGNLSRSDARRAADRLSSDHPEMKFEIGCFIPGYNRICFETSPPKDLDSPSAEDLDAVCSEQQIAERTARDGEIPDLDPHPLPSVLIEDVDPVFTASNASDRAASFLKDHLAEPKPIPVFLSIPDEVDDEYSTVASTCLSRDALDAWWHSLTVEHKAEVLTDYYETRARYHGRVALTETGRVATESEASA